jgi:hypothetical protein
VVGEVLTAIVTPFGEDGWVGLDRFRDTGLPLFRDRIVG